MVQRQLQGGLQIATSEHLHKSSWKSEKPAIIQIYEIIRTRVTAYNNVLLATDEGLSKYKISYGNKGEFKGKMLSVLSRNFTSIMPLSCKGVMPKVVLATELCRNHPYMHNSSASAPMSAEDFCGDAHMIFVTRVLISLVLWLVESINTAGAYVTRTQLHPKNPDFLSLSHIKADLLCAVM